MTTVNVAASGLQAAIIAAAPGDIINQVGGPGTPLSLTFASVNIADPGIAIVLDPNQALTLMTSGVTGGMAFYHGFFAADVVNNSLLVNNYSVKFGAGANRMALRGPRFGQSAVGITSTGAISDIDIDGARFDYPRNDNLQIVDAVRLRINNTGGGELITGATFCYYPDGREPVEGASSGTCTAAGGIWLDASHSDYGQIRATTAASILDLTITNNDLVFEGQGFDTFGTKGLAGVATRRVKFWNNTIYTATSNAAVFSGDHFDVRNNTIGNHPVINNPGHIHFQFLGDTAAPSIRIFGGGNVSESITLGTLVTPCDLRSSTMNGAAVDAAELPRIAFPASFPAVPARPAAPVITTPPESPSGPSLYPTGVCAIGDWRSIARNAWKNATGATFEYRFKVNGNVVQTGSKAYQAQPADAGGLLVGEVRGTTDKGTSDWFPSASVTIAGTAPPNYPVTPTATQLTVTVQSPAVSFVTAPPPPAPPTPPPPVVTESPLMVDLTDAVAVSVYANLNAAVTLAPVFSVVPEGQQPPYVVIGDDTVDPTLGSKDGVFEQHDIRIVTVFGGSSKRSLTAAMKQTRDALVDKPLTFVGANLSAPFILSSDDRVDPQNGAFVGEQAFRIFAQPED